MNDDLDLEFSLQQALPVEGISSVWLRQIGLSLDAPDALQRRGNKNGRPGRLFFVS